MPFVSEASNTYISLSSSIIPMIRIGLRLPSFVLLICMTQVICLFIACLSKLFFGPQSSRHLWLTQRFAKVGFTCIRKAIGLQINIQNSSSLQKLLDDSKYKKFLIWSNHLSYLDTLVIGTLVPTAFVAKKEVSQWPFFGSICKSIGCIFVKRESNTSRVAAYFKLASSLKLSNYCVFPEGSTTKEITPDLSLINHTSLAIPVREQEIGFCTIAIQYEDNRALAWYGDDAFLPHLLKVFARRNSKAFIRINIHSVKDLGCKKQIRNVGDQAIRLLSKDCIKIANLAAKGTFASY